VQNRNKKKYKRNDNDRKMTARQQTMRADDLPLAVHVHPGLAAAVACPHHGFHTPSMHLHITTTHQTRYVLPALIAAVPYLHH